jgi:hypothetical protein
VALHKTLAGGGQDARVFIGEIDLVGLGRTPALGGAGGLPRGFWPVRAVFSSRAFLFAAKSACSRASRSAARASMCALA